jgi:hypothetical protein
VENQSLLMSLELSVVLIIFVVASLNNGYINPLTQADFHLEFLRYL